MTDINKQELKILKEDKTYDIKVFRAKDVNENAIYKADILTMTEFVQGDIGNCGFVATLASLSSRPEFLEEICPSIEESGLETHLTFTIFFKGEQKKITIDDRLPFWARNSDGKRLLRYARSTESLFSSAV